MQRPDVEDPDFYLSDDEDDPMNEVFCVECGRGDDEHSLLLCDRLAVDAYARAAEG